MDEINKLIDQLTAEVVQVAKTQKELTTLVEGFKKDEKEIFIKVDLLPSLINRATEAMDSAKEIPVKVEEMVIAISKYFDVVTKSLPDSEEYEKYCVQIEKQKQDLKTQLSNYLEEIK